MANKLFLGSLAILVLFNTIFYVSGLNTSILSISSIIGIFLTLGVIAVVISIIPTTSAGTSITWFMNVIIFASIFYSISFSVLTYNITIGIGLASNLMNMFSPDINSMSFLPYIMFTFIGLMGVVGGMMSVGGND